MKLIYFTLLSIFTVIALVACSGDDMPYESYQPAHPMETTTPSVEQINPLPD